MTSWLKGIIPPLVTPFDGRGKIDEAALAAEVELQISSGATAVCVGGSTGEGAGLKPEELFDLCSMCIKHVRGRIPVIGGAIPDNTDEAIELSLAAKKAGVKALQIASPLRIPGRPSRIGSLLHANQRSHRPSEHPLQRYPLGPGFRGRNRDAD